MTQKKQAIKLFSSIPTFFYSALTGLALAYVIYAGFFQRHFFSWRYLLLCAAFFVLLTLAAGWVNSNFLFAQINRLNRSRKVFLFVFAVLLAGILVFVPYMGVVVGVLLGTLAGWAQFGELSGLIPVWAVFAIGQLLEGMAITPWLVGERVGLHPVVVIFALMAFGQLFGFVGVLLAIPAAATFLVALRHLKAQLD